MPSNREFLEALFAEDAPFVHVTDFAYDPNEIPADKHLTAWKGDWFSRYRMGQNTNQYFTISIFNPDDQGVARRRKALYLRTPVIVLDDVREKLAMTEVSKLPAPAWVLETSVGSEQWGYILDQPCSDRHRVENLLDGLVANGLAPDGRDPGMKGVTRYVRLPEGVNSKASKLVNGQPYPCRMLQWSPFNRVSLEQLAEPFNVNLDAVRREARVDGAANVPDHPLLHIPEIIHIKEVRSDGRFDIRCPWVDEHTGEDDSGAAVFTNDDGSIGFKCHHGACQHRTANDMMRYIETQSPGFSQRYADWKGVRALFDLGTPTFMQSAPPPPTVVQESEVSFMGEPVAPPPPATLEDVMEQLRRQPHTSSEARLLAQGLLKAIDSLPHIDRKQWHDDVSDHMRWSKQDFKDILSDLRRTWYAEKVDTAEFYDSVLYIKEQNQFFDFKSRIFFTTEAFQNSYAHEDDEARKVALVEGRVQKVDRLDYAPLKPRVFTEGFVTYGNSWDDSTLVQGAAGDVGRWLEHFDILGWSEHKAHMLQWMAFTLQHPDQKINHILLLGSKEGCGKDFLLYPMMTAMGANATVIDGNELVNDFNDYLLNTKYLHVNETDLGDHRDAMVISNKIKPLAAAPPETLRINPKGIRPIRVRNIVNVSMTTNSLLPIKLNGPSRRFFPVWSDLNTRDADEEMTPQWQAYWQDRWDWMRSGGVEACIWYLKNAVDVSNFKPGAPPPVTDFLRDIRNASKSPTQQSVESMIRKKVGAFRCDLISSDDVCTAIKAGNLYDPDAVTADNRWLTPGRVGQIMRDVSGAACFHGNSGEQYEKDMMIWAVRNVDRYRVMSKREIYAEWFKQLQEARATGALKVVS